MTRHVAKEQSVAAFIARVNSFFRNLFGKKRRQQDLDEEIESTLALLTEEKVKQGMNAEEAARAARVALGGAEQVKEQVRAVRTGAWLDASFQDVRFGLRMLRKNPGFAAVAVLTLALGIGANTAIFSLINGLMLRSLPVSDPQNLVMLQWSAHKSPNFAGSASFGDCVSRVGTDDATSCTFTHPFFDELHSHATMFSSVTASGGGMQIDLSGARPADMVQGLLVAGDYFETLGVRPAAGRMIEPSDELPSAAPVVVLNYGYWQRGFGGSLSAVGKTVTMNGVPTTIVGVAERRFTGLTPGRALDVWLPLALKPRLIPNYDPRMDDPRATWILIIGRLKPNVPRKQAEAAASLLFLDYMLHGQEPFSKQGDGLYLSLLPAQTSLQGARGTYATSLFVLMAAVGIVLLIACANVAGLLLARSTARHKEIAVRLALGAGRGRVIRQLLTESVLLSALGGGLGIGFAFWGARAIVAFVAGGSSQPLGFDVSVDGHVLSFTAALSLLTGAAFGLAPAVRRTRVDLTPALKDGACFAGRGRRGWFSAGNLLVIGQVSLTMIVLVGAGLVVHTLANLRNIDPGFDTSNILTFRVNAVLAGHKGAEADALYRNLQSRLSAVPGVISAGYSQMALLSGGMMASAFRLPDAPQKSTIVSDVLHVGPNFFGTMKMPFLEGRDFTDADFAATPASSAPPPSAPAPAIVNREFTRRYLSGREPLGQRFQYSGGRQGDPGFVIVGVVGDAKYSDLRHEIDPTAYLSAAADRGGVSFELRTTKNPASIIPAVRTVVSQVDGNLPMTNVITESESIDRLLFQERLIARLSSFFGALALVLACVGLYGLLSFEVARRTREIGIRMALGAERTDVLRNVVGHGLALAMTGLAVGISASIGVTRYLGSLLYDVHPGDPLTLIVVTLLLLVVAFAACWIPARRAMRVDPMVALRHE